MKFNIKYLVKINTIFNSNIVNDFTNLNNLNDCELNKNYEIELNINNYVNKFIKSNNYCYVVKGNSAYYAFSEESLNNYKLAQKIIYDILIRKNKIKLVKDLIIEEIVK